jgi:hypothetical protein
MSKTRCLNLRSGISLDRSGRISSGFQRQQHSTRKTISMPAWIATSALQAVDDDLAPTQPRRHLRCLWRPGRWLACTQLAHLLRVVTQAAATRNSLRRSSCAWSRRSGYHLWPSRSTMASKI